MYFNLLKTACDFAQLISKNIGDFLNLILEIKLKYI